MLVGKHAWQAIARGEERNAVEQAREKAAVSLY